MQIKTAGEQLNSTGNQTLFLALYLYVICALTKSKTCNSETKRNNLSNILVRRNISLTANIVKEVLVLL